MMKGASRVRPNPVVTIDPSWNPWGIAVFASTIYLTAPGVGNVMSCPTSGCSGAAPSGNATLLAAGQLKPTQIAVDATGIYWLTTGGTASDNAVMRLVQ